MAKSRFAKHVFPTSTVSTSTTFSHSYSHSHLPQTLVWRRITPADCVVRGGPMPSADRVDRLMDEVFVASTWHAIGERDGHRHPRDPIKPKPRVPAPRPAEMPPLPPLPLLPPPPLRQPQPRFAGRYPDVHCEEVATDHGPTDLRPPVRYRLYHPSAPPPQRTNIIFVPPPAPSPFQPDQIIPLLSYMTGATIITPLPPDAPRPFPQPLHDLLKIYDHCKPDIIQTAILAAGIAAPLAASIAVTEPHVKALGIWGGIMDLTTHAERATAWNRRDERWEHYAPPQFTPSSSSTTTTAAAAAAAAAEPSALAITEAEFWFLRRHHFPNPETWMDPFASPHLFFRSAGVEFSRLTLKEIWGKNAIAEWNRDKILEEIEELKAQSEGEDGNAGLIYPRRQSRFYQDFPPEKREMPFPRMRLVLPVEKDSEDDVVASQGLAFAEVYKSSVVRWFHLYRRALLNADDVAGIAESKVLIRRFGAQDSLEREVAVMGHWMKWVLDNNHLY